MMRPALAPDSDAPTPRGRRVPAAERERMIVAGAIRFFAEEGFDGQLRALAGRIGIPHSVLFRHFPSKEMLIARVYREIFLSRWRPEWGAMLRDRSLSLEVRLLRFYRDYTEAIFHFEWVRIFMFAGLKGVGINAPYLALLRENVLLPICAELRAASGLPSVSDVPLSPEEVELAWGLHGRIFYLAIRKFIYGMAILVDMGQALGDAIAVFLGGVGAVPRSAAAPGDVRPFTDDAGPMVTPPPGRPPMPACPAAPGRRRMPPWQREQAIVDEAITFFAEQGMDGQMRGLARRLGVTHPLLYRYFPTKEALIDRVYDEVYLGRWNAAWEEGLRDTAQPLKHRLVRFYVAYLGAINTYEWTRIFIFSGLLGVGVSQRYLVLVRERVIGPVATALCGGAPPGVRDLEVAWGLHGQIFYLAVRRWVYGMPVPGQLDRIVEAAVTGLLDGAAVAMRHLATGGAAP